MSLDPFADVLAANARYAEIGPPVRPRGAARALGVLTCMDSRIDAHALLGLEVGDAKVVRNAGARVTDDVVRSFTLATHLLGVTRIMVIGHTDCALAAATNDDVREQLREHGASDVTALDPLAMPDQHQAILADVERLHASALIPDDVAVAGFMYDVATGLLHPVG